MVSVKIVRGVNLSQQGMVKLVQSCKFLGNFEILTNDEEKLELDWENYEKARNEYLHPYSEKPENLIASGLTFVDFFKFFSCKCN